MRGLLIRAGATLVLGAIVVALPLPATGQSSPSASPDAALDPALATVELMNEVPVGIRETCVPGSAAFEGWVATASCTYGDGVAIYLRFEDASSLHQAYDLLVASSDVAPESGTACREGAFEGEYQAADGAPSGRLLCVLAPEGLTAAWTDSERRVLGVIQFIGETDHEILESAFLAARLGAAAEPGTSAAPMPTDPEVADAAPAGSTLTQWASGATASSQYSDDHWSATQATGAPDAPGYGDSGSAWAPQYEDAGQEWLELSYATAVVPAEVVIWETSGNGFVRFVEAYDPASGWVVLWQGMDDSPAEVHGFRPTLAPMDVATDRIRITIDTTVPGWNEIDAVELMGSLPEEP
jgi:hypothetical protein